MTPQESTMLNDLVNKIRQTQLPEKDVEAEEFLKQSLAAAPDAQYILAQTVLVQNIALEQAKAQMQQLQQRLQEAENQFPPQPPPPQQHTSFLGSLLGRHDAPPPPQQAYPPQAYPPRPAAPQYYPPAPAYPPDYAAAPPPSGGSSFLRSAATTAAGVAAGALAFEGVESLLHGFGHGGGGFGGEGFGGFGGGQRPEETVINNYYDDPNQNFGGEERGSRESSFDGGDRFGNDDRGAKFDDAGYDPGNIQDLDSLDNSQDLGNSGDFDDGGGFDSGDDSSAV
jgi:hypothetical protein